MEVATSPLSKKRPAQSAIESRVIMVDFIAQVVLAIAVGVATSLALAGAVLLLASEAQAQHDEPSAITRPAVSPAVTDRIDAINRNRDLP